MKTYQDWLEAKNAGQELNFIRTAIEEYRGSAEYKIAADADEYEAQRNVTIMNFIKFLFTLTGDKVKDFTSFNFKIASNFFHRLTTQRISYSLGNGISFPGAKSVFKEGKAKTVDPIKEKLGEKFDNILYFAARYAVIHKVSYLMWNLNHADYFKMTEFMPLLDEKSGALRAGFRFWSLEWGKRPVTVVVYEEDGYTEYRSKNGENGLATLEISQEKVGYIQNVSKTEADGEIITGYSNYSSLPIVPFYGSSHKQSALVGMREKIDAYDLIKSGFANTVQEAQEIFWKITDASGMDDEDLVKFRDRLKLLGIAVVDGNTPISAERNEIPVTAKESILKGLREQMYEDYGALDVHTIAAGATNDHIDAAYQSMDDEADDFEYQVIEAVQAILALMGEKAVPIFKRNRISNQKEQSEMVINSADFLDEQTILEKLPFLTPDEVQQVMARKKEEAGETFTTEEETEEETKKVIEEKPEE